MKEAFLCDSIRTPFGRYGGSLSSVRTDDLAAIPLRALMSRNPGIDWGQVDDVLLGCANQAGEDNRNVARMALLLAGLPVTVPGCTINRLCGSGMDSVAFASRAIKAGDVELILAGGVESMSRAPFVMGKPTTPFARSTALEDTTMGWRFINPAMEALYGTDSMPETGENVAQQYGVSREDQDRFALNSQRRAAIAAADGWFTHEIVPVALPARKGDAIIVSHDEHPRPDTTLEMLARLKPVVRSGGTVTAGNASGINDGAAAIIVASAAAVERYDLKPWGRVVAAATAGVEPRIMGMGPVPAVQKVLAMAGLSLKQMDVIELNEALAAQAIAVLRELGLPADAEHVNPAGGAIALGHPLGASGVRLIMSALRQLHRTNGRYGLCTMCVGVGQGTAIILENIQQSLPPKAHRAQQETLYEPGSPFDYRRHSPHPPRLRLPSFVLGENNTYIATATSLDGPWSERYLAVPHAGHANFFRDKQKRMWSTSFGNDRHSAFSAKPGIIPLTQDAKGRWMHDDKNVAPAMKMAGASLIQLPDDIGPSISRPRSVHPASRSPKKNRCR